MRLFAIRDYRRLFSAQLIALFGTGLATVALGLLAYELAGPDAGAVLGTALTIKMVLYVLIAPLAGAYADRLPRRVFLTLLDLVRAAVVLALPFVTEVWQIYVLIGVLQAASAAFTPTFQAVIPDIVTDEAAYTRALSATQVAYTMESLLSPVLAAVALTFMTFNWLFVGTMAGFAASAALVLSTRIPNARPNGQARVRDRLVAGVRMFAVTPRLRGVLALNVVVAAAGSIVVVNTVNYVRDRLGGSQSDVAWMLAASGGGTLLIALALPRVLNRITDRAVMLAGATVLVAAVLAAVALAFGRLGGWTVTAGIWVAIGAGMALIVTPTGRVIRASTSPAALPAAFAAQFSLSHLAWLVTYPIAGWIGTGAGFRTAWAILAGLAVAGGAAAVALWPRESAVRGGVRVAEAADAVGGEALGDGRVVPGGEVPAAEAGGARLAVPIAEVGLARSAVRPGGKAGVAGVRQAADRAGEALGGRDGAGASVTRDAEGAEGTLVAGQCACARCV
ncbi:MFS transporter [Amycolatopsis benzoatilytica]|uniref:MFS transporter n=1 Tax=Amycolatopsis benzoatilytica TaxID=346045 RepID=UPI00035F82F6|nr:MFS transporter [Amycolatopsis benzoatilytica]